MLLCLPVRLTSLNISSTCRGSKRHILHNTQDSSRHMPRSEAHHQMTLMGSCRDLVRLLAQGELVWPLCRHISPPSLLHESHRRSTKVILASLSEIKRHHILCTRNLMTCRDEIFELHSLAQELISKKKIMAGIYHDHPCIRHNQIKQAPIPKLIIHFLRHFFRLINNESNLNVCCKVPLLYQHFTCFVFLAMVYLCFIHV